MNRHVKTHLCIVALAVAVIASVVVFKNISGTGPSTDRAKPGRASGQGTRGTIDGAGATRALPSPGAKNSLQYTLYALKDRSPETRASAADALAKLRDARAIPDLLFRLDAEEHPLPRAALARALGAFGQPEVIPKLLKCIGDPDASVRLAVVNALATWTNDEALAGLVIATADTNEAVRAGAADRLVEIGETAIPSLLDARDNIDDRTRVLRISTIDRIKSDRAIPALIALLRRHAGTVAPVTTPALDATIHALAQRGEPAVTAALQIVREPGNLVLKSAAAALFIKTRNPSAVTAVTDYLLSWKALTSPAEWRLWTNTLASIDTALARESLARVDAHRAEIASRVQEAPSLPTRPPIPPRKANDPSGYTGELSIVLHRPPSESGRRGLALDMELSADSGSWDRVWSCNSFNRAIHEGLVLDVTTSADAFDLHIGHMINDDPWVTGGFADLTLKLKRPAGGNGPVQGSYEGTFRGSPVSGTVTGEERPRRPVFVKDFVPLHPDEHPRLLFRQHEVASVRKRAVTPFGAAYQEVCNRTADVVNLGMLYQITGDPSFAESARRLVESYGENLCDMEGGFGSGGFGHRLVRVALAYDLCYDAWPEAFRKQIQENLRTLLPVLQKYIAITGANYHPSCNFYGPGRGAPAITALALWGEKGPKPPPPPDPFSRPSVIPPAADYTPSPDTPVAVLTPGRMPDRWLIAGPAPFALAPEAEQSLMTASPLRPQPGTARRVLGIVPEGEGTKMAEAVFTFAPAPRETLKGDGVDLAAKLLPSGESTFLLATVVSVTNDQTVSVHLAGSSSVWVNGTKLSPQGCFLLRPGLYQFIAICTVQAGRATVAPRFVAPDSPEMSVRNAEHRFRMALWKADCEDWERYGGADPFWMRCATIGYWHMFAHYRVGMGDGGFQAETGNYADIASWFPLVYASMATRAFGRLPSPYNDVTHMVPRRMMQVYFPANGDPPFAQKLNSCHGLRAEHCAAIFPALPEQFRGPILWGWNRVTGAKGSAGFAALDGTRDLWGTSLGAALTFLNYPFDVTPAEPAKSMPLTWEAKTFGFYCFRNGWEGKDEFIAQVFLKAFTIGGWNDPNAGAFRLFGLGHEWVTGNQSKAGIRQFEPVVVLLPEWVAGTETDGAKIHAEKRAAAIASVLAPQTLDTGKKKPAEQPKPMFTQNALSHLTYYKPESDGSAVLSLDYRDVYAPAQKDSPAGITGMRSLAFDYSRGSGAPCLIAIVDRIEGNVDKVWLWPLPQGCISNTTVKGNTFVVRQGDATMKGTFVSPANVKVEATSEEIVHLGARLFDKKLDRIKARGDGSFLVVITIQRGNGPVVKVAGNGLDAQATVGNQTVKFDGTKIVVTPTP